MAQLGSFACNDAAEEQAGEEAFSPSAVNKVVSALLSDPSGNPKKAWLSAVARRTVSKRPDLAPVLERLLGVPPSALDVLKGLSIGELSVCYEALLAELDGQSRKRSGQFFTPDDAAQFMVSQAAGFPAGMWLDPCSGVGNLAWHLTSKQDRPHHFVRSSLTLIDRDPVALKTAVALIGAAFLSKDDEEGFELLASRAEHRDFLSKVSLPEHDFAILNPPYARTEANWEFETAASRDTFAYFLERVAKTSKGYVAVTPASYVSAPRYRVLRSLVRRESPAGRVFVFDNVPDTFFRGYKFGSTNTSTTNFVRAAVTVGAPKGSGWTITPILRWQRWSRASMFRCAPALLGRLRTGPNGEWAKVLPGMESAWERLSRTQRTLEDLVGSEQTPYRLDVALTPRYFISAASQPLRRASKATLYFTTEARRDQAAAVLNSSVPYFWWRTLDGGVSLPRRVLRTIPIPDVPEAALQIVRDFRHRERDFLVVKRNAGRLSENLKPPREVVQALDEILLPDALGCLTRIYANNMFPSDGIGSHGLFNAASRPAEASSPDLRSFDARTSIG